MKYFIIILLEYSFNITVNFRSAYLQVFISKKHPSYYLFSDLARLSVQKKINNFLYALQKLY